jgi:heterodisulfide reductase subunit A-like polyferredoxin
MGNMDDQDKDNQRIMDNPVKTGVFFCTCGHMLDDYFDIKALMDYAGKACGVTCVSQNRSLCTKSGLEWLKAKINACGCDRIVIAGCSPQQHELSFMKVLEDAGLNRYFLTIANIREGCAWVCRDNADCMPKARQILSSAIKRVAVAKPVEKVQKKMIPSTLVIGAGLSGIQMALELHRMGIEPILVEKQPQISKRNPLLSTCIQGAQGMQGFQGAQGSQCTRGAEGTWGTRGAQGTRGMADEEMFAFKVKELGDKKIEILTSSEVTQVSGGPGAFRVTLDSMGQEKTLEVGSIVVSTGSRAGDGPFTAPGQGVTPLRPSHRIVGLSRLRDMITAERRTLEQILVTADKRTKYVCFILGEGNQGKGQGQNQGQVKGQSQDQVKGQSQDQVKGQSQGQVKGQSQGQSQGAFAKTATIMALNEAIALKKQFKAEVMIAARDITVCGTEMESLYRQARQAGILFFRSPSDSHPQVSVEKGVISVRVYDPALGAGAASGPVSGSGTGLVSGSASTLGSGSTLVSASASGNGSSNGGQEGGCGRPINICADLLVFEDEILPGEGTESLHTALKVNLNKGGFYQEENIHLKPNLSNRKGIFLAGACHGKEDIYETLNDVRSVAMAVYSTLSGGSAIPGGCVIPGYLETERKVIIDTEKCALCLTCIRTCPHRAIEIGEVTAGQKWGAKVIPEACQGCGICAGECPAKAIEMIHYSDNQIFSELTFEG